MESVLDENRNDNIEESVTNEDYTRKEYDFLEEDYFTDNNEKDSIQSYQ